MSPANPDPAARASASSSALKIAAGIFSSRIVGLLRQRAVAHFFGVGAHADVFQAALRGPNLLQNLLGEGTISAAFIPIYSRMLEEGREEEAGRFAGAIFTLLLIAAALFALAGVLLARPIVLLFQPGWIGDAEAVAAGTMAVNRFELTVQAVRIIFPMTGVLVLSAWALGVLNSHRKFLLPYIAPVAWNAAIIVAFFIGARLFIAGGATTAGLNDLLMAACWGALAGGVLQLGVQLPGVAAVLRGFRIGYSARIPGVRSAVRAFGPVVAGRGVYQVSAYLDQFLASFLAVGAVSAILYAQLLYVLPISLFGMSVAASELPELSRITDDDWKPFVARLDRSLRQVMFLTVPTTVGYLGLGYLIVGALYRTGSFNAANNWLVYFVLAGYTLGLIATTASRLLQNACYALRDTRTPAKIAVVRVVLSALVAVPAMFLLDRVRVADVAPIPAAGEALFLGGVGLAVGSVLGAWVELILLHRYLRRAMPDFRIRWNRTARMFGLASACLVPAFGLWYAARGLPILAAAALVGGLFAALYLAGARRLGMQEIDAWLGQITRRLRGPKP